ncbi:MAG: hypothetical protein MPI93_01890 [Nitrosopumilus sp.]|nr:hypothetical protein [Nitrosopumilus sp.]
MREETARLIAGAITAALIGALAAHAHTRRHRAGRIAVPAGTYARPQNASPGRENLDALADAAGTALLAVRTADRTIRTYRILKRALRD